MQMDGAAPVAVVGRGPHGDGGLAEVPLVPLHHQLVCARHKLDAIGLVELGNHQPVHDVRGACLCDGFGAKEEAGAARTDAPAVGSICCMSRRTVLAQRQAFRVGPQQVAHGAVVRDLDAPLDRADLR